MHLYVHVPFCARRCSYCDFSIAVRRTDPSSEFAAAILTEWQGWQRAPWWAEVGPIESIYFGGGTPSRVTPETITVLLERFALDRVVRADAEITLEANPEDVDRDRARGWRGAGVNRVSLGVQSFTPSALRWMHRVHDADRPAESMATLRDAGIGNVSIDLIYGLPGSVARSWPEDLDRALRLDPEHLSLYGLTVEPATPLGKWVARGDTVPAPEGIAAAEYLAAHRVLAEAGWNHYEVSNASRPGFESRHNQAYWRRRSYLGLGPAAHSAHGNRRWWNLRDWAGYQRAVAAGGPVVAGQEDLTGPQVALEQLYLGLRTREGVPASSLPATTLQLWEAAGWAEQDGSRVRLTVEGWLRLDSLVRQAGTT